MSASRVAVLAMIALGGVGGYELEGAGVQKVVQMLQDMNAAAKKNKQEEEVSYSKFSTWCGGERESLAAQMQESELQIEGLTASIGKLISVAAQLGEELDALHTSVDKNEASNRAQKAERAKEHSAFLAEQRDYAESIDALDRAIATLQKQNYDRAALVQLSESQHLPAEAQSMISAFIGMMGDDASSDIDYTAPEANAYEFQSGSIVELLKKLQAEFTDKKGDCEKEEANSRHASEMMIQDLTDMVENAKEDIDSKTEKKQATHAKAAGEKKQLSSATAVNDDNKKLLSDTKVQCAEKKESFAEKQQLRAEEIEALTKAIEILSSEDVQAAAAKHLDLAQKTRTAKATALAQSSVRGGGASKGIHMRIEEFLNKESARLHSTTLGLLAEKLAADPFSKVKKLIDDMITRLLEEAHADADHEGFCDKEIGQSKITRDKLSVSIDNLAADVENGKASISMLAEDISRLSKEVAELDASMQEATLVRLEEKEKNAATVKDAKDAQHAVAAATAVLKDFYGQALSATALLQAPTMGSDEWNSLANPNFEGGGAGFGQGSEDKVDKGHKAGMHTFGANYQGQQDEAGGVMALLEVISSDFATLQADTESSEALNQKSYEEFMVDAKRNKAVKSRAIEMNGNDKMSAESQLREDTADMKFTQDKLLAAERYHEKLVPQCVDKGQTFDERTAARASEIQSLKEALRILSSENLEAAL